MKKNIIILILFLGYTLSIIAQTDTPYRATPERKNDLKHTKLKIEFDFQNQMINAEAWISLYPYFYPTDSLVLDAKSMQISSVSLNDSPLSYHYDGNKLKIKLDKIYQKGQQYQVYIKYSAQYQNVEIVKEDQGVYFINPKGNIFDVATQVWTQGQAQASSYWFPTIDEPNQKTTQEIEIITPDKFLTLSNGVLEQSYLLPDKKRLDRWVMDLPHSPYLFFVGVGDFVRIVDTPWRGKVPIDYFVEKPYESLAHKLFEYTNEMMEFYSQRFGYDFPWEKYSQIVVREFTAGAMENTTAVVHSESAYQPATVLYDENHWEPVIAHEMAHHWFGDLVTAESWSNLTVNESFANYAEYLWYEYKYSKDRAMYHLNQEFERYLSRKTDYPKHLVRFHYSHPDDVFDAVSYSKGGVILHMLRHYLGDEAFFEGIAHFLKTYAYASAEVHQLRLSFEKVSGKDLTLFFNQWYYGYGHPIVQIKNTYDAQKKKCILTIKQTQKDMPLFAFDLDVDIYTKGKGQRYHIKVKAQEENQYEFVLPIAPDLVDINPQGVILMEEHNFKTAEQYLFQYRNATDFKSRWQAVFYAYSKVKEIPLLQSLLWEALKDPFDRIRKQALEGLMFSKLSINQLSEIVKIAQNDSSSLVRSAAMWVLMFSSNNASYASLFKQGLKSESASIRNASIKALSRINPWLVKEELIQGSVDDFTFDQLNDLIAVILTDELEQMKKYLPKLLPSMLYYEGLSSQEQWYKKGFEWAMQQDDEYLVEILYQEVKKNTMEFYPSDMIQKAISLKNKLPKTPSVKRQIKRLKSLL